MKKLRGAKSLDGPSPPSDMDSCVHFRDMLGVSLKRLQRDGQKEGEGVCQGINIYVYDQKEVNRYKERVLVLTHPSEDICTSWIKKISKGINGKFKISVDGQDSAHGFCEVTEF